MTEKDEKQITLTLAQSELGQVLTMLDFAQENGYFRSSDPDEQPVLDAQNERFYAITGKLLDAENEQG